MSAAAACKFASAARMSGPPSQQVRGQPHRHFRRGERDGPGFGQIFQQIGWRTVQQNAQRKNILLDGGFQRGNGCGRRRHLRVGIGLVQRADEPGHPFLARHVRRMHFGLQIGLRNGDLFLRAAHLDVVQRHFRRQRHLRAVYIFAGGLDGGVVGLKLPPRGAKKIQIPHRRRACAEARCGTPRSPLTVPARVARSRSGQGRPQSARILPAGGARLAQQRLGQLHVQIGSERRIDQLGQLGVLEPGPPLRQVNRVGP